MGDYTWRVGLRTIVPVLACAVIASACVLVTSGPTGQVAINELMPSPDVDDGEFLELRNLGGAIDVSGWCFTEGIDACLPDDTVIDAFGFLLVVQDEDVARSRWGIPDSQPLFTYDGGQKGGGETITLVNATGQTIDEVTYGSADPWPTEPAAGVNSLERINPNTGSSIAANWTASSGGPTPLAENSTFDISGGDLLAVGLLQADPVVPQPGESILVSVHTSGEATATLTYRVNFEAPVTVAMSPGSTGLYFEASIPGQGPGDLVRYRVDAVAIDGEQTAAIPGLDASITYHGVVVANPSVTSSAPIIEWFMEDAVYEDLLANHRYDDVQGDAVIAYDGQVWDGVKMRVRGNISRRYDKVSWKVQMPDGYLFNMGGLLHEPVDEFALQRDHFPMAGLGWDMVAASGQPEIDYIFVRQQRNGEFHGLGAYLEVTDGRWRDRNGFDDGSFYSIIFSKLKPYPSEEFIRDQGWVDKKEGDPDDFTDLYEFTLGLNRGDAELDFLYDNLDVPEVLNYLAVVTLLRHVDSAGQNYRIARDGDTDRWELLHWDFDWILHTAASFPDPDDPRSDFPSAANLNNAMYDSIFEHPELEAMFYRRVKTMRDEIYGSTTLEDTHEDITLGLLADYVLERQAWDFTTVPQWQNNLIRDRVQYQRDVIDQNTSPNGKVPQSQPTAPDIAFDQIEFDPPGGSDEEYVELVNNESTAIDVSGWSIDTGIEVIFKGGTVMAPGQSIYFVKDDPTFRSTYGSGNYVGGTYKGKLSNDGETIRLLDADGSIVQTLSFG